ncbi:MAG: hypothetical protein PUA77_04230 [Lachnospiraceae bacterium]|nr:hypothetical protein [Lachnospiraceae bacterium]
MVENILVGAFVVIILVAVIIAWKLENGRADYMEKNNKSEQESGEKEVWR